MPRLIPFLLAFCRPIKKPRNESPPFPSLLFSLLSLTLAPLNSCIVLFIIFCNTILAFYFVSLLIHFPQRLPERKNWGRMCSSFHSQQASGHTMSSPNPAWTPPYTHTHLVTLRRTSRDLTGVANQPSPWDTSRLRLGQKILLISPSNKIIALND